MHDNENYLKAKRAGKDTVFTDLFHIPRYTARLVNDLHEDLTVTEDEVTAVTLHPILLNRPYNDLGILIRDKLLLFVEAQSTWSMNVLVRLLIYLGESYSEYIKQREYNVYGTRTLPLPKPEFYVIYTGDRNSCPNELSLAKDLWGDENAAIDLRVKIISENASRGIAYEYIMFCKIFNEQVDLFGYTLKAVKETIRICRDRNILRDYLQDREKEAVTAMSILFDQEYAVNAYAKEYARDREICTTVESYRELGQTFATTVKRVAEKFNLSPDVAESNVKAYWQNA